MAANERGQVQILESNGQAMNRRGRKLAGFHRHGRFQRGAMDGSPVKRVYPDQTDRPAASGTGSHSTPHPEHHHAARGRAPSGERQALHRWSFQRTEERLAASRSAQIPVRGDVPRPEHVADRGLPSDGRRLRDLGRTIGERTETLKETFRVTSPGEADRENGRP